MGDNTKNQVLDRKRLILDGAAEILAANGFHGARMAQIAGASGITGPALYRHFAGKDALHAAVIERGMDIVEDLLARTASAGAPEAVLGETIAGLARVGVDHAPLWLILLRDARYLPDGERARHARRSAVVVTELTERVRAVRTDLDEWDAELVARALLACAASPSAARVRGMNDARRRRLLESTLVALGTATFPPGGWGEPAGGDVAGRLPEPPARAARREAIIDAAHHLFRGYGFHAVSMEDIALAAGVTGPTVYSYFESKAELLAVAQQRGSAWLALSLDRALRVEQTPARRFVRGLGAYVDFALDHGDTLAVLVLESCNLPEEILPTVLRDHHDFTFETGALLRVVRPEIEEPVARALVCSCLDIVSFLAVSRRYVGRDGLRPRLLALLEAVTSVVDDRPAQA